MSEEKPSSEASQKVEALKRKVHERIGAWIVGHWTQLASALAGIAGGVLAMYAVFHSQIQDSVKASSDAKSAAQALIATVGQLQGTVAQLVTQQQLSTVVERVTKVEDKLSYAHDWKPDKQLGQKLPRPKRQGEK